MRDDRLPFARILGAGAALVGTVALAIVVVVVLVTHRPLPLGGAPVAHPAPPGDDRPMLQSAPQDDLAAYRREKAQALGSFGWVDAASGVAHIPIDDAMALMVARAASAPATAASHGSGASASEATR